MVSTNMRPLGMNFLVLVNRNAKTTNNAASSKAPEGQKISAC